MEQVKVNDFKRTIYGQVSVPTIETSKNVKTNHITFSNTTINIFTVSISSMLFVLMTQRLGFSTLLALLMLPLINRIVKCIISSDKDKDYTIFFVMMFAMIVTLTFVALSIV